jgi:hypothetical protein
MNLTVLTLEVVLSPLTARTCAQPGKPSQTGALRYSMSLLGMFPVCSVIIVSVAPAARGRITYNVKENRTTRAFQVSWDSSGMRVECVDTIPSDVSSELAEKLRARTRNILQEAYHLSCN